MPALTAMPALTTVTTLTRRTMLATPLAAGAAWTAACGSAATTKPQPPDALPPVIVWASDSNQADLAYFQRHAQWFEEAHPNTKVELLLPPTEPGDRRTYAEKMVAMFAGGEYPDMFHLNVGFARGLWSKGALAPFDPFVKATKAPVDDFIPGATAPYRINGQLWGLPRDNAIGALFYNQDLFAAAGVRPPDSTWQWDTTLLDAAKRLTDPDKQQVGIMLPLVGGTNAAQREYLRTWGADWYDAELREATINSPRAVAAIQFLADLVSKYRVAVPAGAPDVTSAVAGDPFLAGRAALAYQYQGYVLNLKRARPSFRWDVAPLCRDPRGAEPVSMVASTGHCIPKGAKHPDAGFALTLHLIGERVQKDMMSQGRWTTPRASLLPFAVPADGVPASYREAILERSRRAQGAAPAAAQVELSKVWQAETPPLWQGQRTAKETLDAVKVQWDALLTANPSQGV